MLFQMGSRPGKSVQPRHPHWGIASAYGEDYTRKPARRLYVVTRIPQISAKPAANAAIIPNHAKRWCVNYLRKRGKRKVRFSPGVNTNFSARKGVFLVELRQTLFSPLFPFTLGANPLSLPFSHEKPFFPRFPSNRFFLPPYGAAVCPLARTPARIPHPCERRGGLCLCRPLRRSRFRSPFHVKPRGNTIANPLQR